MDTGKIKDRFQGALLFSAIGDALGWPQEFSSHHFDKSGHFEDFVSWSKIVGGRFFGYLDDIQKGSYSDDTQLTLSIARSINDDGTFNINHFSYLELPLWLWYQRGGGSTVKIAARSILRKSVKSPLFNFYQQRNSDPIADYCNAGANGAAMRVLPIALVNSLNGDDSKLLNDCISNSLVTHGHPRAILGTMLYAFIIKYLITYDSIQHEKLKGFIIDVIKKAGESFTSQQFMNWITTWNNSNTINTNFLKEFQSIQSEALSYLNSLFQLLGRNSVEFYQKVDGLGSFKGSGLSTVFIGIYLFLKHLDNPIDGIIEAVNILGSDTDTIASFVGGLFGTYFGIKCIPQKLADGIQDRAYLKSSAIQLAEIAVQGKIPKQELVVPIDDVVQKIKQIKQWENEISAVYQKKIAQDGIIHHPIFKEGKIKKISERETRRENYKAILVDVDFSIGQSCRFHSRINKDGTFSESLNPEIKSYLKETRSRLF